MEERKLRMLKSANLFSKKPKSIRTHRNTSEEEEKA